ncbi:YceI family protein [Rhodococcus sp. IEGM 1408]|uniref:YceI family protein n=1 Tax=Rhodococcus sp. IEGM 1408 TaxID=3082220 RepID=UPI002954831E|nr:YceI family protein [Rhodococcus sp. IEGM 1408]MDV8002585.1 YceI family protein [Rhodococcus sp. IEGM 1408]
MTGRNPRPPTISGIRSGDWRVIPESSTAGFTVRDKLVTTVHGTVPIRSGNATLASAGLLTQASVELDATSIDTGNAHRDRDLAKPGILDTAAHPVVVVTAGPSTPGPQGWELAATLAARGAQCPLTLQATPLSEEDGGIRVQVRGRLDRKGLGMSVPSFIIGRYLDLDVDLLLTADT